MARAGVRLGERRLPGYNPNITEDMYVDELRCFLDAARGGATFPSTLREDAAILGVLEAVERSSEPIAEGWWHEFERRTPCHR